MDLEHFGKDRREERSIGIKSLTSLPKFILNNMKNQLTHFALHIDNIERAKKFYGNVFSWGFNNYGSDDFLQITADVEDKSEIIGALQSRKYSPVKEKVIGMEGSIQVENVEETMRDIIESGGTIVLEKTAIPYVGWIVKFRDTEDNLLCVVQYDQEAR